MNKSVLISIQPKWCELIASGRKTVEVRKSSPTETPFKCYIYQTKKKWIYKLFEKLGLYQGKVVGEFVCDRIDEYESEFWNDDTLMQNIRFIERDEEDEDWVDYYTVDGNEYEPMSQSDICKQSCLSVQEIWKYVGVGLNTFYGWHISDLKIYEKPKELGEFKIMRKCTSCKDSGYESSACAYDNNCRVPTPLTCPPQSWYYVEEI